MLFSHEPSGWRLSAAKKYSQATMFSLLAAGVVAALCGGCAELPSLEDRPASQALPQSEPTRLGQAIAPLVRAHPGRSGLYPLQDAHDAFAARVLLARAADRTLDVQYYIWRKDMTGILLLDELRAAADRGVRVRLLLDDNNTSGLDGYLAALDGHPNIEVRLFNPFVYRDLRIIGYLTDFSRMNRRMHNKSFTADSQATIIGGRNIGDEYFGAADDVLFADLDVMAVGAVTDAVSKDFERYWGSRSSYPASRLLPAADPGVLDALKVTARDTIQPPAAQAYIVAVRQSSYVQDLMNGRLELEWAATRMVSDDPAKVLGLAPPEASLPHKLKEIIGTPRIALSVVSPYFVPGEEGVESLVSMARRGVEVQILTNSLEATDVAAVHAGYAKRRAPLLAAGIKLFESRRRSTGQAGTEVRGSAGAMGSSATSLHAKTFAVDGTHAFIGSFNFDPRSANLNTEMGFVIDSPSLARQIAESFEATVPANAYQVTLDGQGQLVWLERRGDRVIRHDTDPGTSFWQRAAVRFLSLLPIEWLL